MLTPVELFMSFEKAFGGGGGFFKPEQHIPGVLYKLTVALAHLCSRD